MGNHPSCTQLNPTDNAITHQSITNIVMKTHSLLSLHLRRTHEQIYDVEECANALGTEINKVLAGHQEEWN